MNAKSEIVIGHLGDYHWGVEEREAGRYALTIDFFSSDGGPRTKVATTTLILERGDWAEIARLVAFAQARP